MEHFMELISDPAHLAFELVMSLVIDGIIIGLLLPFIIKIVKHFVYKEHMAIDAEHGVVHKENSEA